MSSSCDRDPDSLSKQIRRKETSVWRGPDSVFQILTAWCTAGIARKKAEHEDSEEKEDDRIDGDLEGEHGDRPASVTAASSYGARQGQERSGHPAGEAIGVD